MKHVCARCGADSSIFWFPHAEGCNLAVTEDEGLSVRGGCYFELCDDCELGFRRYMEALK